MTRPKSRKAEGGGSNAAVFPPKGPTLAEIKAKRQSALEAIEARYQAASGKAENPVQEVELTPRRGGGKSLITSVMPWKREPRGYRLTKAAQARGRRALEALRRDKSTAANAVREAVLSAEHGRSKGGSGERWQATDRRAQVVQQAEELRKLGKAERDIAWAIGQLIGLSASQVRRILGPRKART